MSYLPDWDSIESTSRWSDFLFWAGIVCLVLLAATEVASHIYGSRSSFLSGEAAQHSEDQRKQDEQSAETRRKAEVEALQKQLAEADKKAATALQQQVPRHLTDAQKQTLIATLSPFAGQEVQVATPWGDGEAKDFAEDFMAVFKAANWNTLDSPSMAAYSKDPGGLEVILSATEIAAGKVLRSADALMKALNNLGLEPKGLNDPSVRVRLIDFRVGHKPQVSK